MDFPRNSLLPILACTSLLALTQRAEAVSDSEVNNLTVDASALCKGALPASVLATQVGIGSGQVLIGAGTPTLCASGR